MLWWTGLTPVFRGTPGTMVEIVLGGSDIEFDELVVREFLSSSLFAFESEVNWEV